MTGSVLVVPQFEKGKGGGHLTRCINLVSDLRSLGRKALLYCPLNEQTEKLLHKMNFNPEWLIEREKGIGNREQGTSNNEQLTMSNRTFGSEQRAIEPLVRNKEQFNLIVLDRFQTSLEEINRWKMIAPVIGIDEGGKYRDNFDFLIDILVPEKLGNPRANICSPSLIKFSHDIKHKQDRKKNDIYKVLITFGQEDIAGLGVKNALLLSKLSKKHPMDITLLRGALSISNEQSNLWFAAIEPLVRSNVHLLDTIPNLSQHLSEYDLVITHYGLTAYEALYSGTSVLLDHPTSYHKKLAKAAGFLDMKHIKLFLNDPKTKTTPDTIGITLAEMINSFSPLASRLCPVCKNDSPHHSIARFNDRTYRKCSKCASIYMDRACPPPVEYSNKYFFEQYKNQYGKTYLEDFENIKKSGIHRLDIIKKYLKSDIQQTPVLLDIGCAYGPFLSASLESGFAPVGIDPSEDAVNYVQQKLNINGIHGFFPIPDSPILTANSYDVITLWYVLEHFTDCVPVFAEIQKLLKPNGILAFSTPSFSGVSGRKNMNKFLAANPADHYTIWSPKMCKKALEIAGFKVKKIVIAGHHPERFPLLGKLAMNRKNFLYWLLLGISKLFRLGDTFEVYAVKQLRIEN